MYDVCSWSYGLRPRKLYHSVAVKSSWLSQEFHVCCRQRTFDHVLILGELYKFSFSSLLGPNICLGSCFQISSLNVKFHVSQPYFTTGNIVLCTLIFKFFESAPYILYEQFLSTNKGFHEAKTSWHLFIWLLVWKSI